MVTKRLQLDAPIRPNEGLGGLLLRTRLRDIQGLVYGIGLYKEGRFELVNPFEARYYLGSGAIMVSVDVRNGKVFRLSAQQGYKGSLFGSVFVGMSAREAMALHRNLYFDWESGGLLVQDVPGVILEFEMPDPPPEIVETLVIESISVYADEVMTPDGQRGDW